MHVHHARTPCTHTRHPLQVANHDVDVKHGFAVLGHVHEGGSGSGKKSSAMHAWSIDERKATCIGVVDADEANLIGQLTWDVVIL